MKRVFMFLLLAVLLVSANCLAADFMNLSWGDPLEKLGEVTELENDGLIHMYIKVNDVKSLGSLPVTYIHYFFYDNKLIGVIVESNLADRMFEILKAKYGEPHDFNQYSEKATWISGDTFVTFKKNIFTNKGEFILGSISLSDDYLSAKEKQAAKDAASF